MKYDLIKISMTLMLILSLNQKIYADIYSCPTLPVMGKVGEILPNKWHIKYNNQYDTNIIEKYYQRYFGEVHTFQNWISHGISNFKTKSFIQCCGHVNHSKLSLCIRKTIYSPNCKFVPQKSLSDEVQFQC